MSIFISCETGGGRIPESLSAQIAPDLVSPDQIDAPACYASERLAKQLGVPLIANEISNDLVDVGLSRHHRRLFGPIARSLSAESREQLIDQVYDPYRERVAAMIKTTILRSGFAIHLSVRSFDSLCAKGRPRRTDIGLLYDPASQNEVDLCLDLVDAMYYETPNVKLRRNHPSRGTNDSITKSMRARFDEVPYLGIEVWLNRAWAARPSRLRDEAIETLADSILEVTSPEVASPEVADVA